MPPHAKCALYFLAAAFVALAGLTLWRAMAEQVDLWSAGYAALLLTAAAGLARRVAWGRFLASGISVLLAFAALAILVPDRDIMQGDQTLERLFGAMPPVWVSWLVIVAAAFAIPMPAVVVSLPREWFRDDLW
ncbi:hypothetical protein C7C56_021570 [Massilia glaciei]|uniref:Uncharacterized protein n=2 Tax=Massilia glaciei TaxID=1524097 RepID=A0A2U2HFK0_9BURK|nr:hypothetical protein C7C56_021570 [Massilia glaciei]